MDFFQHLTESRQTQPQVQDARRRMNQGPAISDAQSSADTGIAAAGSAQQRADEGHSRFTNTALNDAHTKADNAHSRATNPAINQAHNLAENVDASSYKKSGVEPAVAFVSDRPVGIAQAAFVRHVPADRDTISIAQRADGSLFFFNDTAGKELLSIDRTGAVTFSGATLSALGNLSIKNLIANGFVEQTEGLRPNFTGNPTTLAVGTAATYSHNFGAFPKKIEAFLTVSAGVRKPLAANGVSVESYTINQITIRNNGTQSWEVGCFLWK